jgi:hypothetical protein
MFSKIIVILTWIWIQIQYRILIWIRNLRKLGFCVCFCVIDSLNVPLLTFKKFFVIFFMISAAKNMFDFHIPLSNVFC